MSDVNNNYTFSSTDNVTSSKLNAGGTIQGTFLSTKPVDSSISASDVICYYSQSNGTIRACLPSAITSTGTTAIVGSNVNQSAHGFSVGQVLYYTGSAYALAEANSFTTSLVAGIVSNVIDVNNFTLAQVGMISGLSGLTAGSLYYLSDSTAGALTSTAPTNAGSYVLPIYTAVSTTQAVVNIETSNAITNYAKAFVPVGGILDFGGYTAPSGFLMCDGTAYSRSAYGNLFSALTNTTQTINTTNLSTTITMGSTLLLFAGMGITGSGIATGTTISSVTNATTAVLSIAATATASSVPVVLYPWGSGDGSTTFNVPNLARQVTVGNGGTKVSTVGPRPTLGATGGEEVHTMTQAELVSHAHSFSINPNSGPGGDVGQSGGGSGGTFTTNMNGSSTPFNVMQLSTVTNKIIKY